MAIHHTTTVAGDTLIVQAAGFDESLEQVLDYGMAIIAACAEHGVTCVLCDELALEYRLGTVDTYRAAEFVSAHAPAVANVAIVCQPTAVADARFWEDVAVNRGLEVRVFTDTAVATRWLKEAT